MTFILWAGKGERVEVQAIQDRWSGVISTSLDPVLHPGDLVQTGFRVGRVVDLEVRESVQTFRLEHVAFYLGNP